jgi:UDP-2-acetamido-3-amino-2,3-dideoxy-glucuronate N-acetyltransferase
MSLTDCTIHHHALIDERVEIGAGTKIWAFAHILSGAIIGSDCNICDHTFIEGGVKIGDRVTLKSGVYLWDGIEVENDVFIGPNATFTNDRRPRSRQYPDQFLPTRLMTGCSIGANATILPGLTIGCWSLIGAGSVVTRNIPDHALAFGNPAMVRGWICVCGASVVFNHKKQASCACGRILELNNDSVWVINKNEYSKL